GGVGRGGVRKGSTFWVSLPTVPMLGTQAPPAALESRDPVTLKGVSVLIVDDQTDARELLVAMLEDYGAEVHAVGSAAAALEALNGGRSRPDILVSDGGEPGADGFALVREIRSLPAEKLRKLPAIAVTAYANPEDRVRALVAGYQHHIPKPVDPGVLAVAIAQLVAGPPPHNHV